MGVRSVTSRDAFQFRLSMLDATWAIASPLLALSLRDAQILSTANLPTVATYCGLSLAFSVIAFMAFRVNDGVSQYFSTYDAINIIKAVVLATLLTYFALFTLTRLEGIPRSTPLVHALLLAASLAATRLSARLFANDRNSGAPPQQAAAEYIIMIGATRLSSLYLRFMEAYSPVERRIVALLDDRSSMMGRTIERVRVAGPTSYLEQMVEEFAGHGVRINRVIVGIEPPQLSEDALSDIQRICQRFDIALDFVPHLVGLCASQPIEPDTLSGKDACGPLPAYFFAKRILDVGAAGTLLILLSPIFLLAWIVTLLDVGSPALFWQQRLGQGGRTFLLHKFRTLKPPFDRDGHPIPDDQRLSWMGRLLRNTRLDELPQLLNVLVGDMSMIGPRPLLPRDQPSNPAVRLSVRPGITGWAQVNGGKLLNPDDKDALDEWYIRHASLWLDLRITVTTILFMVRGERRSEHAISAAHDMRGADPAEREDRSDKGKVTLMPVRRGPAVSHGGEALRRRDEEARPRSVRR